MRSVLRGDATIGDLCYTANSGPGAFSERAVYVGATREELQAQAARKDAVARPCRRLLPKSLFCSPGRALNMPAWAANCTRPSRCSAARSTRAPQAVKDELQPGLLELLYGNATDLLNDTRYTQPAGSRCSMRWRSCGAVGESSPRWFWGTASANMPRPAWRACIRWKTACV